MVEAEPVSTIALCCRCRSPGRRDEAWQTCVACTRDAAAIGSRATPSSRSEFARFSRESRARAWSATRRDCCNTCTSGVRTTPRTCACCGVSVSLTSSTAPGTKARVPSRSYRRTPDTGSSTMSSRPTTTRVTTSRVTSTRPSVIWTAPSGTAAPCSYTAPWASTVAQPRASPT